MKKVVFVVTATALAWVSGACFSPALGEEMGLFDSERIDVFGGLMLYSEKRAASKSSVLTIKSETPTGDINTYQVQNRSIGVQNFSSPLGFLGVSYAFTDWSKAYCQHTSSIKTDEIGSGINGCGVSFSAAFKAPLVQTIRPYTSLFFYAEGAAEPEVFGMAAPLLTMGFEFDLLQKSRLVAFVENQFSISTQDPGEGILGAGLRLRINR
jgi:hypothetical protein